MRIKGYKLGEIIYQGKNSIVYKAEQDNSQKKVIIKILNTKTPIKDKINRFKREYHIASLFNHNKIINVFDLQSVEDTFAIIMEDFGGVSLDILNEKTQITPIEVVEIALSITDGLSKIHENHIIHKDINLSNIVWNKHTSKTKIIDFGISTELSRENLEIKNINILEGTLQYMSPEQTGRMNRSLDYRTDFYSLGITLYKLISGKLPFEGSKAIDLVHSHIAVNALPLCNIKNSNWKNSNEIRCLSILSDIVKKLMEKEPEQRYQSSFGIKHDLKYCQNLLNNKSIGEFRLGEKDIFESFQIPQKLYGRKKEIDTLMQAFRETQVGNKELLLVSGYSGTGKSALVNEIHKPIIKNHAYFTQGKFDQFKQDIPYSAFQSALSNLIKEILLEENDKIKKWREKIVRELGKNGQIAIDLVPELELLIGKQATLIEVGLDETKNRFIGTIQNFIRAFGDKDNPVVIFLDDLQWADLSSLKLIEYIMKDLSVEGLLIIGAYRDNEVNELHPLTNTLENIKKEHSRLFEAELTKKMNVINEIRLHSLQYKDVTELIKETLHRDSHEIKEFSEICFTKTAGNPFFLNQFLNLLYKDKIINLDYSKGKWKYDINQIKSYTASDNVIELMEKKISKLNSAAQNLIKLSACLGNKFSLKNLSIVAEKTLKETAEILWIILTEGLIEPLDEDYKFIIFNDLDDKDNLNPNYAFIHDRVQQAAYSLISEREKKRSHLTVARLLLNGYFPKLAYSTSIEALNNSIKNNSVIFEIVNHYSKAVNEIENRDERILFRNLLYFAAQKTIKSNAYQAAYQYLKICISLVEEELWNSDYSFMWELNINLMEMAYYNFKYDEIEDLAENALLKAKDIYDKTLVYKILIKKENALFNLNASFDLGLTAFKQLGIDVPKKIKKSDILIEFVKTEWALKGKSYDDLYNLPVTKNQNLIAMGDILYHLMTSLYLNNFLILLYLDLKLMQLSLKLGNFPKSIIYPIYGLICFIFKKDYEALYSYGMLGLNLCKKETFKAAFSQNSLLFYTFNNSLKMSSIETLEGFNLAHKTAIELGDYEFSGWNLYMQPYTVLYTGLDKFQGKKYYSYDHLFKKMNISTIKENYLLFSSLKISLKEKHHQPWELTYEKKFLTDHADNAMAFVNNYIIKIFIASIFKKNNIAQIYEEKIKKNIKLQQEILVLSFYYLHSSLNKLAIIRDCSFLVKKRYLSDIKKKQKKLKLWSTHAPMNHLHRWHLVEAELAKYNNDFKSANLHFIKSIELAKENSYIRDLAVAYELYAMFWVENDNEEVGANYIKKSYDCYEEWEILTKCKDMEKEYAKYLHNYKQYNKNKFGQHHTLTADTMHTTLSPLSTLDLISSQNTLQIVANEMKLKPLINKVMEELIKNSGSERGYIILPKNGKWILDGITIEKSIPILDLHNNLIENDMNIKKSYPINIIKDVINSKENIILSDAYLDDKFGSDIYIKENRVKSVLCSPLINQGKLTGVIYLENNLASRLFTNERVEILKFISSQATVSIENTRLYEELKNSEDKFRGIFENSSMGIFQASLDGKILMINPAGSKILGYNSSEELENNLSNNINKIFSDKITRDNFINQIMQKRKLENFEFSCYSLDKKIITISLSGRVIKNNDLEYIEGIFEDISKKKLADKYKLEKEVAEASTKAKSSFLANMSHEIRTPMNAVIGLSELALKTELNNKQRDYIFKINNSGKNLLNIINDILDYSKIDAGKLKLEEINFNIYDSFELLNSTLDLIAREKNIELISSIEEEFPKTLIGDFYRLNQILLNLAGNAVKFTERGQVKVSATILDKTSNQLKVKFSVKDTGIGIDKNKIEHLFKSFYQADTSITRNYGGTGLGLTISKQLIELMGGNLSVKSKKGVGSLFSFELNFGYSNEDIIKENEVNLSYTNTSQAIDTNNTDKVLIVEDNPVNQQILRDYIGAKGISTDSAIDGEEAINKALEESFALILMDIQLPKIDGLEATKQIRALGCKTPIVAITAHAFKEDIDKSLAAGMNAHLSKPINFEELDYELNKWISNYQIFNSELNYGENFEESTIDFSSLRYELKELHSFLFEGSSNAIKIAQIIKEKLNDKENIKTFIPIVNSIEALRFTDALEKLNKINELMD